MSDFEPTETYETVTVSRAGGAARIELNRPDSLNAWNAPLARDLRGAVDAQAVDDEVRAVLITGAGRAFSSGADVRDLAGSGTNASGHIDVHTVLTERYHPIITGIREMPKPVVCAINGGAVGIGCSLALACDLILAAESAYLLLAFVNIGLVADGGSSMFVPTRAGATRAAEMAMLGERIPAGKAADWGLVNRVVPDEQLATEAQALTLRLAAGPTRSYAGTKRQLNAWLYGRMHEQLRLEADIQQEMAATADVVEGATAFAQKRTPQFRGT
ncbi:MAG: enoyl-CoA hydratase [Actinomycetota bacterium]|jgi:2-(1,2-epoxy-1,2-dihydrophenyl)acetyl-CoA isomerase|nr:enoyl-CoA hydratase [Solirubrobacterales bacterium]MDQ3371787.1 enoyl-CoA hydratase [Actinomycetota bacterium]